MVLTFQLDSGFIPRAHHRKPLTVLTLISTLLTTVGADFECLCCYKQRVPVHTMPFKHAFMGNMSFFDCKPTLPLTMGPHWKAIAYKHKIGYVNLTRFTVIETCLGQPSPRDLSPNMSLTSTSVWIAKTTSGPTSLMTTQPAPPTTASLQGDTSLCFAGVRHNAVQTRSFLAQFRQSCYEIKKSNESWHHAEASCQFHRGHLVTINDFKEQAFIEHILQTQQVKSAWIGLHDRHTEQRFEWISGQPVRYTNLKPGHLNDNTGNDDEDCVLISDDGKWNDVLCAPRIHQHFHLGDKHHSICEFPIQKSQQSHTPGGNLIGR